MIERKFGRLRQFDEMSRLYPIRQKVRGLEPISKYWPCGRVLDQGAEGSCVGHGIAHEIIAEPVPVLTVDHEYAVYIYNEAKKVDEWPGEDYEGTSVLAGLKVAKSLGWYDGYRWGFSLDDLILAVGYEGPAVMGTNWYTGMMDVDSSGFVHATGYNEGGHCYIINAVDVQNKFFTIHNSWGFAWGVEGEAKVSYDDMQKLLDNMGEQAFVEGRHEVNEDPEPPEPPPDDDDNGCFLKKSYIGFGNAVAWLRGSRSRVKGYRI